uniref:Ig-like domain-containing protein n=1 Tax=Scophthalmus maximus TaxID=52904 RepID=A0A8D3B265_SCOMX
MLDFLGESLTHAPPQEVEGLEKVLAFAGGDVILPCTFSNIASRDFPTVEWSKEDLKPNIIFLYRDGCEIQEMKNPAFEFRTSFVMKNLEHGGISLRISNVKLSDAGRYMCKRLWKNSISDVTTVELVVGIGFKLTLLCEASCWLPEPDITFLDDQGNEIPAKEDPKRDLEASGCYTVRRRVPLPTATNMKMKRFLTLKPPLVGTVTCISTTSNPMLATAGYKRTSNKQDKQMKDAYWTSIVIVIKYKRH